MAHDVFISHSAKNKTTGDAVCAMLESEGIRCWIAPRDVTPGRPWPECIIEAIEQSQIMVLVFTADANVSLQIHREVQQAVDHGVAIIPFRVEDVPPVKALDFFTRNLHWLDALTPPMGARLKELVEAVKKLLARSQPEPHPRLRATPRPTSGFRRVPLWAWGGVAALALAIFGAVRLWPPSEHGGVQVGASPQPGAEANECMLIGQDASFAAQSTSPPAGGRVAGLRWVAYQISTKQRSTNQRSPTCGLMSIFGTSDGKRLWATGMGGRIVRSVDGGASWLKCNSTTTNEIDAIFATADGERLWAVGANGTIMESYDGGANWKALGSPTGKWLKSIVGTGDGAHLWAAGASGTIVESDNGGNTWSLPPSNTDLYLNSIFAAAGGTRLWAVGDSGRIVKSENGGKHWERQDQFLPDTAAFESVSGTRDGKHLWAAGEQGKIVNWIDGESISPRLDTHASGTLNAIFVAADGRHLWAVGINGIIVESDDGGADWGEPNSNTTENLTSIFGTPDGMRLWAVSDQGTIFESIGGN